MYPEFRSVPRRTVLLGSMALTFGAVFWAFQEGDNLAEPPGSPVPSPQTQALPPAVHVAPDPHPRTSVLGTDASVSDVAVRLQLFATSPGLSPRDGTAVLGTHASNPQTYAVKSVLASGAILDEIHADHVVLLIRGIRTRLYKVGIQAPEDEALIAATTVGGPGIADRPVEKRISSYSHPTDFIRPRLVFESEKVVGFEVSAGRGAHRLAQLDLEPGDIIRKIDGRPVSSDADWQRLTAALGKGASVVLEIDRKESSLSIVMDGAWITSDAQMRGVASQSPPSM
jgi:general secretion pathway protein C